MAVHQWDYTYFLDKDELKKLKKDDLPEQYEIPKHPKLDTAERVFTTKEEIKRRELEKEQKKNEGL